LQFESHHCKPSYLLEVIIIAGLLCQGTQPSWCIVRRTIHQLAMSARVVNIQEEEELPVVAQPGSPEPNENNPFLSGLQQSGIFITGMTALLAPPGCHFVYTDGLNSASFA